MSISSIASRTNLYSNGTHTWFPQLRKALATLATSLASGDLTGAQKAFAALTEDRQNVGQAQKGPQATASSQLSTDLEAIGSALQSGDLTGAQKAFAVLTQNRQRRMEVIGNGNSAHPRSVGTNIDVAT